ncbi:MAG TPA: hypothetical protein VLE96_01865 [Chlamydiales bacterium]|nr:hypothetical protein [Chlamydiales bacterium]
MTIYKIFLSGSNIPISIARKATPWPKYWCAVGFFASLATSFQIYNSASAYWSNKTVTNGKNSGASSFAAREYRVDAFGNHFDPGFFESSFFREKILPQCAHHSALHAVVGITVLLLQLIQSSHDQSIVYKAIENFKITDLYAYHPSLKTAIDRNDGGEPSFCSESRNLYYQFALEIAFAVMASIRFSKGPTALTQSESDEVIECLKDRLCLKFHGTNSFFLERIKAEGMSGSSGREYHEEIKELTKDLGKDLFGWYSHQSKAVFYQTRNPEEAFHYAKGSPEWFQSFLCDWNAENNSSNYFRYEKRDSNKARELFHARINQNHHWTEDQQKKVERFYEKYWQRFGTANPALIVMRADPKDFRKLLAIYEMFDTSSDKKQSFIKGCSMWFARCDPHDTSDKAIPPSELRYYTFPTIQFK